ncbi:hypothetical protein Y032_0079g1246 [Ancylostoma ceylanicum]|uniref:ERAP1-like C-terminal domain-containing protein n=1 Tax=Ancylostoma ceylanicum TaxID=53326 RepID=A0A016TSX6_9BILA|nr:hypothetical protein Y032_0079g1246 [Ancylostoma ceylanicum]
MATATANLVVIGGTLFRVKNLYELEDDQGEKDQLIKGMSCSEQVSELKRQLLNALDQTGGVRLTDINTVFVEVSRNPLAEEIMINFLIERWEMIIARFRGEFQLTERIIKVCLGKLRSEGQILLTSFQTTWDELDTKCLYGAVGDFIKLVKACVAADGEHFEI